jgi:glucokinase
MPPSRTAAKSRPPTVIALDLGGTKLASALFAADDPIPRDARAVELGKRTGKAVGKMIVEEVSRLRRAARRRQLDVAAVGISVPGIAQAGGVVWAAAIAGWQRYPLGRELLRAYPDLMIVVDDDRAASILGEVWQGAARGCRDAVFIAVGTGIGAGILADGRVVRGAHGIAGAIGWLALDRPFRKQYVDCGCFEHHASGEGLAKMARELGATTHVTSHHLFKLHSQKDELATEVIRQAIQFWGMAAANLVSLLNPEKVIFGGGVFGPAAKFLASMRAEAKRWAQPISMKRVKFEVSRLGPQAALYGAAYLALQQVQPQQ